MKEHNSKLLKVLEEALKETRKLAKEQEETALLEQTVQAKDYWRVIVALRRCRLILEDLLPHLPKDKKEEVLIYMNAIGGVEQDASVYAKSDYLYEFVVKKPATRPIYPKMTGKKGGKK